MSKVNCFCVGIGFKVNVNEISSYDYVKLVHPDILINFPNVASCTQLQIANKNTNFKYIQDFFEDKNYAFVGYFIPVDTNQKESFHNNLDHYFLILDGELNSLAAQLQIKNYQYETSIYIRNNVWLDSSERNFN